MKDPRDPLWNEFTYEIWNDGNDRAKTLAHTYDVRMDNAFVSLLKKNIFLSKKLSFTIKKNNKNRNSVSKPKLSAF